MSASEILSLYFNQVIKKKQSSIMLKKKITCLRTSVKWIPRGFDIPLTTDCQFSSGCIAGNKKSIVLCGTSSPSLTSNFKQQRQFWNNFLFLCLSVWFVVALWSLNARNAAHRHDILIVWCACCWYIMQCVGCSGPSCFWSRFLDVSSNAFLGHFLAPLPRSFSRATLC
jgi:hypothetical protein